MKTPKKYSKKENGKNATGAPSKYDPKYCAEIVSFFNESPRFQEIQDSATSGGQFGGTEHSKQIPAPMPTFFNFARKIGVDDDTLQNWGKTYPEFFGAYNTAKELQKQWMIEVGLSGLCPPASFIFVAKNVTDMKDKTEQDINLQTFEHFQGQINKYQK